MRRIEMLCALAVCCAVLLGAPTAVAQEKVMLSNAVVDLGASPPTVTLQDVYDAFGGAPGQAWQMVDGDPMELVVVDWMPGSVVAELASVVPGDYMLAVRPKQGTLALFPLTVQAPARVPQTGQELSYGTRDDGELQTGVEWPVPRFHEPVRLDRLDRLDGTVVDNLTGLIWLKDANCFGAQDWDTALASANGLADGQCGLTDGSAVNDWRLPNMRELHSLIDYGEVSPALPASHLFSSVQSSFYWSSTTDTNFAAWAWRVNLNGGVVIGAGKAGTDFVWPVRGGQ